MAALEAEIKQLKEALELGFQMRKRQREFFASKGKDREALIDSKRLETSFDIKLAELGIGR